jgi:hypothetical protein
MVWILNFNNKFTGSILLYASRFPRITNARERGGVLFNMTVKKADWSLARGMAKYIKQGGLTRQQLSAARRIRDVFTGVTIYKEVIINQYLLNIIK